MAVHGHGAALKHVKSVLTFIFAELVKAEIKYRIFIKNHGGELPQRKTNRPCDRNY